MRKSIVGLTFVSLLVTAGSAAGLIIGFEKTYKGGGAGKVVYSGQAHNMAGVTCNDCHPDAFVMVGGASDGMTMREIQDGKYCGICHNGTKAFNAADKANCKRCHQR